MEGYLKRTILVYGIFAIILALELLLGKTVGVEESKSIYLLYLRPINIVLLAAALYIDTFGSLCVLLAFLPFSREFFQIEIGVITFNPYTLGVIGLSLIAFYKIFFKGYKYSFSYYDLLIISICLTFFISTIRSKTILDSGFLAFHSIFIPVISYFVIRTLVRNEDEYRRCVIFLIGGISLFGIEALIRFVATHERVSIFSMPFIGIATMSITAIFYLAYSGWWKKVPALLSLLIISGALFSTLSRVYFASVVVSPILYRLIRKGKGFILMSLMITMTLILTLWLSFYPGIFKSTPFEKEKGEKTAARLMNINLWKEALHWRAISYHEGIANFSTAPVFGVGLYKGKVYVTRHNFHVEWLEYGGIVGYLLYTGSFLLHFLSFSAYASLDRFIAINLLILLVILSNSFTNGFMHGIMPYIAFVIIGFNEARRKMIK